ncbi:MAG: ribbon-helix-helix protein, CopG family [Pseudomonadota bacterium]|nr:ribbon-helix-helix protein, CopG family [Pseudomonadota bacterium]
MSALLTVRLPENEKAAIERAAAASGRSQSSLASAAISHYVRELAWLEEKVAKGRASRDLSDEEVNAMFSELERE